MKRRECAIILAFLFCSFVANAEALDSSGKNQTAALGGI